MKKNWNVGPNFFVVFYICTDFAISFLAKCPVKKFSPSTSPSQSPLSGGLLQNFGFSEKITFNFCRLRSQILLINCWFSDFSYAIQHNSSVGKVWNGPLVASFHLRKRQIFFYLKSGNWQYCVLNKYRCFNASKWSQMHQKWINTIPFGSLHTLGTLNHGLGSLFCCVITVFGAGGSLDLPGAPLGPLVPPRPLVCHPRPQSVIMGHVWPIWSE